MRYKKRIVRCCHQQGNGRIPYTQQQRQQPRQQSSEAPTVTTRETPDLSSLLAWFGLAWLGSNLAWLLFIPTSTKASKNTLLVLTHHITTTAQHINKTSSSHSSCNYISNSNSSSSSSNSSRGKQSKVASKQASKSTIEKTIGSDTS